MKKTAFLAIFLLILSACVLIFPKTTYAELDNTTITAECQISKNGTDFNDAGTKYTTSSRTFSADYNDFASSTNGAIKFIANARYTGDQIANYSYEWKNSSSVDSPVLSGSNELIIYKKPEGDRPIISVGKTVYILKVTDTVSNKSESFAYTISITDTNNLATMLTTPEIYNHAVTTESSNITFTAKIPVTSKQTIVWYIMGPNDTSYNIASAQHNYTFKPSECINGYNGFGDYKIMATGTSAGETYYSQVYTLSASKDPVVLSPGNIVIKANKVKNTQASIEAHKYYLYSNTINIENLDFTKIYWYVNNQKVASGQSFIYEPLTTDTYKVSVKYDNGAPLSNTEAMASLEQTPNATDTYMLFVIIGAVVVILSIILVVSIKVSNKKRDVVW